MKPTIPVVRDITEPRARITNHAEIVAALAPLIDQGQEVSTPYTRSDNLKPLSNAVCAHGKKMGIKLGIETKDDGSVWLQRHA